jgi:opacity protein-like surface antigen
MIKKTAVLLVFASTFNNAFADESGWRRFNNTYAGGFNNTYADKSGAVESSWKRVFTFSAGPSWSQNGKTQTFFLQPDIQKTYDAQTSDKTLASGEVFLGLQRAFNTNLSWQFGLALAKSTNAKLAGDIWEDADPAFNNFFYNYSIEHTHIAAKGKIIAEKIRFIQPYVSGSIGIGFNRAYDFDIKPKIFEEVPAPPFNNHTNTSFTYTLGAGIQKAITQYVSASVGYEFSDWGKNNLAAADGQTLNSGLSLNHLYTSQLQFGLTLVV